MGEATPARRAQVGGEHLLCRAGPRRLAVPAARVREVASLGAITPVPLMPGIVLGLTQLRGQILPVLAAHPLERSPGDRPDAPLLVVELGPVRAALLVDELLGISLEGAPPGAEPVDVGTLFDHARVRSR